MEFLWVPIVMIGASAQTLRNAMQHTLTAALGTAGATQVRFVYGLPFAILFLIASLLWTGETLPWPSATFMAIILGCTVSQIGGTALMLMAMRRRSFAVTIAYTKTEPVQVALFAVLLLGDPLTGLGLAGVLLVALGIAVLTRRSGANASAAAGGSQVVAAVLGILAGAGFALTAVAFRGAVLALPQSVSLPMRASYALVVILTVETALLVLWLLVADRQALIGSFRVWRSSLFAGFMGALASLASFAAMGLAPAASVRAVALLVEVVLSAIVAWTILRQRLSSFELAGILVILFGAVLLLASQ